MLVSGALLALSFAGSASAAQVPINLSGDNNEITLQEILNDITVDGDSNVDVTTDQQNHPYWGVTGSGGSFSQIVIEVAGNAGENAFGIFDASNPYNRVELFGGPAGAGDRTVMSVLNDGSIEVGLVNTGSVFSANLFGFYLEGPGGLFFSDPTLNQDGAVQMVAFQGPGDQMIDLPATQPGTWTQNEWLLAWEDLPLARSDYDYNDFVVMIESIEPRAVPEPMMLGLLGLGLLGLVMVSRRRGRQH